MKIINQELLMGERALFKSRDLEVINSVFCDGESPLKESRNIKIRDSIFKWKYPLWYCKDIEVDNSTLIETARSGIWYTNNINIKNSTIEAPKTFRHSKNIDLTNINIPIATETLWNCQEITLNNVNAKGDYFGMNSENIVVKDFNLSGNYAFDGAKNVEVYNSRLLSKDAFWNCENVTVNNSVIIGEYLGWNSKNLTFIDCFIESNQGLCYVENLVIRNSKIINTDLSFEYSTVEADITTKVDSVKNPMGGRIHAKSIDDLIMDDKDICSLNTKILVDEGGEENAV